MRSDGDASIDVKVDVAPDVAAPTCSDGMKNGTETDTDCGGSCSAKCADGKGCSMAADCTSNVCSGSHVCSTPACGDNVKNGSETDIDCGGTCSTKCADGKACLVAGDCTSGVCPSGTHVCSAPVCTDNVKNGNETDIDCGGSCAPNSKCADGKGCSVAGDCTSGVCSGSHVCSIPACNDNVQNGNETDTDCGGSCTNKCGNGKSCSVNGDCTSGLCNGAHVCISASCTNSVKDTNETGVDCGGPDCGPCDDGIACALNRDCKSGKCTNLVCTAPTCTDGVKNGSETDTDCGGSCTTKCDIGKICGGDADCTSGHCPSGACVECVVAANCSGTDNDCQHRTCNSNACGIFHEAAGTPTPNGTQTAGDCRQKRCDGNGNVVNDVDDTDKPDDGKQCTNDVCMNGTPSNPLLPAGTPCTQNGGSFCSDASDGTCVQCNSASTCAGPDNECQTRACSNHACGFTYAPIGMPANTQMTGDCHTRKCVGAGSPDGIADQVDDTDLPVDNLQCTFDMCNGGTPSNPYKPFGTACNQNGGMYCNDIGQCAVQCVDASNCPDGNECQTKTCALNVCGFDPKPLDTVTPTQVTGDCHTNKCDGNGNVVNAVDDTDTHDDGKECTDNVCTNGNPSNPNLTAGTPCSQNGGSVCSSDNNAACVACNVPADCVGTDDECHQRTCTNHVCGVHNEPDGPTATQTAGDCHKKVCSAGTLNNQVDDTDTDDGNTCTTDSCSAGTATHTPLADGTTCAGVQGGRCEATTCTPTFMVVRIGDGAAPRSSSANAVFLERRYLDSIANPVPINGTVNMPIAASGNNKPLTMSGSASSEGSLSLSQNGQYVTLAGYGVIPGTASVKGLSTANANRVVGRVDGSNNVDTTTAFTTNASMTTDNVRGATTIDGTRFWVAGAGSGTTGGVWTIDFTNPPATTGTQILTAPKSPKVVHVFSSQLYGTAGGSNPSMYTVGSGTPTSLTTATVLPGLPTNMGQSFFSFVFVDKYSNVPGLDTLYIADENPVTNGGTGGIQKWKFNGTTWALAATFTDGLDDTTNGVRGLAGMLVGNTVMLVATTAIDADALSNPTVPNKLVLYQDDDVHTPTQIVIGTSPNNTIYRGVALAP